MLKMEKPTKTTTAVRSTRYCTGLACSILATLSLSQISATAQTPDKSDDAVTIQPGDERFNTPAFDDYQAVYTSSSSKTGGFTLQVRKSGDGKKLAMIDIIPMPNYVIVAQRQIDLKTHRAEFGSGPFFAWGQEFVVSSSNGKNYSWTRTPIGPGAPKQMQGTIANGGYVSEMFSPTLASLMPMSVGTRFQLPEAYPRKGEFVSSEYDSYQVLRKENLSLPSGFSCDCWMIEKKTWNGMTEHIWVSRKAPFVFRRIRDVGGKREFQSDLLAFTQLKQ
ncbi:hypothetical protein [Parasphingorhabdus sp.]|uniref:hypothetical protein n=1 Tax=Parasphingorhabdus sp. TaxID=2709688 RepID=UPI003262D7DF